MAEQKSYSLGRRERALDDWACRLFAPATQSSDGKEPFLFIDFRYNHQDKVRDIQMGVNLRKGGKDGKIDFFPNLVQFNALCEAIRMVANDQIPDGMVKMEVMTTFMFGKKLDRPETEFMIVVGKDQEGVFIGITQKGRDNVKFYFTGPRMTILRNRAGEVFDNSVTSKIFAIARANMWESHINYLMQSAYLDAPELEQAKEAKKRANQARFSQNQGRQGGGGNSWGGNGGGNGGGNSWGGGGQQQQQQSAPPADGGFDNDIPW
ncbi:hypothetical protein 2050HW_00321 [Serratia phage vB_SmaM_ 2050HW]|uniref:Uncharacterized protein n=1 Tax=Serratia phage vB_SmaM_ 2050HW TaxID=2024252 RepID=A0A289YN25_9CAUD|nr:hypothetical protein HWB23_gp321 [Serratia phage vB_SmaM_ 2050HW]ATA65656.1 hypothetical protein 2050HW_00321 [Serratia phage vB_SmaM_ 2050HW]URG14157.1 hypothetical protein [Pectobacterium phage vB_ParM-25]